MNQGEFERLFEIATRRALTAAERRLVEDWLATHPEARPACGEELALSRLLEALPDASLSPQFTARVLAQVERDDSATAANPQSAAAGWRAWLWRWRVGVASLAVVAATLGLAWQREARNRALLAESVAALSALAELPDLEALAEFELVYHLPTGPLPDEQELAKAFE